MFDTLAGNVADLEGGQRCRYLALHALRDGFHLGRHGRHGAMLFADATGICLQTSDDAGDRCFEIGADDG